MSEIKQIDIDEEIAKKAIQIQKELEDQLVKMFCVPSTYFYVKESSGSEVRMKGILSSLACS